MCIMQEIHIHVYYMNLKGKRREPIEEKIIVIQWNRWTS